MQAHKKTFLLFTSLLLIQATLFAQDVSTFAGSGTAGNVNATGTSAEFNHPAGVATDGSGNIYVADRQNHSIRKITSSGVVSTLAGSGTSGSTNGTGTAASFTHPIGIAVDGSGNVYVAEFSGHRIRKITSSGVVSTLAGSGAAGSVDGTGTGATFNYPVGLAIDGSGNLYVADQGNQKIRKITPAGAVTTFASSGDGLNTPSGLAFDGSGNLFVTNIGDHKILKITPAGVVTVVAGSGVSGSADGTGTAASFNEPKSIAYDGVGNLYVADYSNHKIRKVTSSGVVTTFAGSGSAGSADGAASYATFYFPYGVTTDGSGNIYVGGYVNHKIRKITTTVSSTFDESEMDKIKVYGNSFGQIVVEGEAEQITVVDLNGKIVYSGSSKLITISTPGTYIVQLQWREYKRVQKVTIL